MLHKYSYKKSLNRLLQRYKINLCFSSLPNNLNLSPKKNMNKKLHIDHLGTLSLDKGICMMLRKQIYLSVEKLLKDHLLILEMILKNRQEWGEGI